MRGARSIAVVIVAVMITGLVFYHLTRGSVGMQVEVITPLGCVRVHYDLWTVAPNGSIVKLASGSTNGTITVPANVLKRARTVARIMNSSSAIVFVDSWVKRGNLVYAMPLQSFEVPSHKKRHGKWKTKHVKVVIGEPINNLTGPGGLRWVTKRRVVIDGMKLPLMIVQGNTNTSIEASIRINSYSDYVGPRVTVVYGCNSSNNSNNLSAIRVSILDSAFTGTYYIGMGGEVRGGRSWMVEGVYLRLVLIEQEESVCPNDGGACTPTGEVRYLLIPIGMRHRGSNPMMVDVWKESGRGTWGKELLSYFRLVPPHGVAFEPRIPVTLYDVYRYPWSSGNMTSYAVGVAAPAGYELRRKTYDWLPRWFDAVPIIVGNSMAGDIEEVGPYEPAKVYGGETILKVGLKTSPFNGSTMTDMPFGYYLYVTHT